MMKTKRPAELTITRATSQARRVTDRIMPDEMTMVSSKGSWDLTEDRALMITEISYPAGNAGADLLAMALTELTGYRKVEVFDCRILLTRTK